MIEENLLDKIRPGARIRVWEQVKEGGKKRESVFEGVVIARKHGREPGASFTVRTTLQEVGVEKNYPIHSPNIIKVEIVSSPKKLKRAKLYYIRGLSRKKLREKLGI